MDNSPPNTGSDDSEALGGRADGERMRPWEVLGGLWVLATVRPAGTSGTHRSPARAWALWLWCSVCVSGARFKYAKLRFNLAEHSGVAAEQMQQRDASAHVCFTDRRDEQGIDGKWRASPQPPAYPECTVGHAYNGRCPMGAEGKRRHQDFHATSCVLPPMDVQDFAQVIGHGATLWFIGDSISEQMISSLLCLMRAGGFDIVAEKTSKIRCFVMTHLQSKRSVRVCRILTWVSVKLYEDLLLFNANAHHAQTGHQVRCPCAAVTRVSITRQLVELHVALSVGSMIAPALDANFSQAPRWPCLCSRIHNSAPCARDKPKNHGYRHGQRGRC
jgi:hypothetical protein